MMRFVLIFMFFSILPRAAYTQRVPLGAWQSHSSYQSGQHVLNTGKSIFCASYNGLFGINITSKKSRTFSKSDGLSDAGISSMAFNKALNLLLLAYRSGTIDLIFLDEDSEPREIIRWNVLTDGTDLPDLVQVNRIVFKDQLAYLCTNFGIVILDPGLRQVKETYRYIGEQGAQLAVTDLAFASDSLFALTNSGIRSVSMNPAVNKQYFANWKNISTPYAAVSIASKHDALYAGLGGKGIFVRENGNWKGIYPSVSKYYSLNNTDEFIAATLDKEVVTIDAAKNATLYRNNLLLNPRETVKAEVGTIWVADRSAGLVSNLTGEFEIYTPATTDTTLSSDIDSVILDKNGITWSILPSYFGGGITVTNKATSQQRILTSSLGAGSLPSNNINSLAMDQDGFIWFASDKGIGYIVSDAILDVSRVDAVLPVYGQRKLFSSEKCTAIATEPGNRKWIGTKSGLYLFNEDATELIQHFSAANSPLPSNDILTLKFDDADGNIYINTPKGLVSYQSNSSVSQEKISDVTIFPNPVRPSYVGVVGIKGLVDNSVVKITDLSGRLVYESKSEGGTASWNLNDYTGRRARGGMYMILLISEDGSEKFAGKLAIID